MNNTGIDQRVREMFDSGDIDFKELSREFPVLARYFNKTSPGEIERYQNGVMSVVIEGLDQEIPSTFGYLPKGDLKFNTGPNQETMHFLFGNWSWREEGKKFLIPGQYDQLIIPAEQNLILDVRDPSLYVCDYSKS